MNQTTVLAVAGLATTLAAALLGPVVNTGRQAKRDREASLRDLCTALYVDALMFAEHLDSWLSYLIDPYYGDLGRTRDQGGPKRESITPRMRLVASAQVQEAWAAVVEAHEKLLFELQENGPQPDEEWSLPYDDPDAVALRNAIDRLGRSTRQAMGVDGGDAWNHMLGQRFKRRANAS